MTGMREGVSVGREWWLPKEKESGSLKREGQGGKPHPEGEGKEMGRRRSCKKTTKRQGEFS